MAAGGNASFPVTTGSAPGPAALPLADAALDIFPYLNDTDLAHEIAADLGLVSNLTTAAQASSRGGTPGWTTGLLAALISVAVIISVITVFVLIHRNLRRQRREVLESFLAFQEAEAAAIEAANTTRQRFLARASRAAAPSPRQHQEPPVVVVQPDLSPSLCIKESFSTAAVGGGRDGSGTLASAPATLTSSGRSSGSAGGSGEQGQAEGGSAAAIAAAATAAAQPGDADLEAGTATAAGGGSASAVSAARAARAAPLRRLALDFPGLGATMLLLLPSGPHSAGVLVWNDGSGASVLPGGSWRAWGGALPPHEPPPVFQSTIELAAHTQEGQEQAAQPASTEQQQQQSEEEGVQGDSIQGSERREDARQDGQQQQQQP